MRIGIENVRVYGLKESVVASGYPMHCLNTLPVVASNCEYCTGGAGSKEFDVVCNTKDWSRAEKLGSTKIASGHDQFLTGIIVQFDLTLPVKVWTEAQRYHFLDFVSSGSTMHALFKTNLGHDGVFDDSVDKVIIDRMVELQKEYAEDKSEENFLKMVMSCPAGIKLTARMTTNYRQLKTIYSQRKEHRLPHWRMFCEWIELLPHAKEFGVVR